MFWNRSPFLRAENGYAVPIHIMAKASRFIAARAERLTLSIFAAPIGARNYRSLGEDDCIRCFYHGWNTTATANASSSQRKTKVSAHPENNHS